MLNKTDVSDQITGLRPKVRQAAVHLAHHLTKEIKKCQGRKGPKAEKFHKKAETYRKEVLLLKKIKEDSVSRYALRMDFSEREKLLGDINLPLETKVIVKLATHNSVASHIKSFREKHPDWASKLPNLLETLGIRAKFKKKIQKEQEKQKRKLSRKQATSEGSNEVDGKLLKQKTTSEAPKKSSKKIESSGEGASNSDIENSDSESDVLQSSDDENVLEISNDKFHNCAEEEEDNGQEEEEEEDGDEEDDDDNDAEDSSDSEDSILSGSENAISSGSEDAISSDSDAIDVNNTINIGNLNKCDKGKNKALKLSKSKSDDFIPMKSRSKFAEVRRFSDLIGEKTILKDRKEPESISPNLDENSENELGDNEAVEEDTFFMTGENRFLKTTAVKRENGVGLESSRRNAKDIDEEPNQWSIDGKILKGNRAERRAKFLGRDLKKRKPRQLDKSKDFTRPAQKEKKAGGSFSKFPSMDKSVDGKPFKHQQFDRKPKNGKEFPEKKGNISGKTSQNASSASEALHPSWEAKRKQKVSLDNFQGKKIKFDD